MTLLENKLYICELELLYIYEIDMCYMFEAVAELIISRKYIS